MKQRLLFIVALGLAVSCGVGIRSEYLDYENRRTIALSVMASLLDACEEFKADHGFYPLFSSNDTDERIRTDSRLINLLIGLGGGKQYFIWRSATYSSERWHGGLVDDSSGQNVELVTPWLAQDGSSTYYSVAFDYDDDGFVDLPFSEKRVKASIVVSVKPIAPSSWFWYDENVLILYE